MRQTRSILCQAVLALLCTCVPAAASADTTEWLLGPAGPGDWFDAGNWTDGMPDPSVVAVIDDGGTAVVTAGTATGWSLRLAIENSGTMHQSGGSAHFGFSVYLGYEQDSFGTYLLDGGALASQSLTVGASRGSGLFKQVGGNYDVANIIVGDAPIFWLGASPEDSGEGRYELIGGQLDANTAKIGARGLGIFRQSGGIFSLARKLTVGGPQGTLSFQPFDELTDIDFVIPESYRADLSPAQTAFIDSVITNVYIPPPVPSEGRYELSGGQIMAREQFVDRTGVFLQTGGSNQVGYLSIGDEGRYEYLGGSLHIVSGLHIDGVFDFGGGAMLSAGSALVDFSKGLENAEHASINVGADSLTIFAADFDLDSGLGSYHTEGITHFTGSDLVLAAGEGFRGWGEIDDHVIAAGTIAAADGGFIHLKGGIEVSGDADVDLGDGTVTVTDDRTVIRGGSLLASHISVKGTVLFEPAKLNEDGIYIYQPPIVVPAIARQTGGSVELALGLSVSNGRFELSGGELITKSIGLGGSFVQGPDITAEFVQTGGVITTDSLAVFNPDPFIRNFPFVTTDARTFNSSVADTYLQLVPLRQPKILTYRLDGGTLSTRNIKIGIGFGGGAARFIQTGGDVQAAVSLGIMGGDSSYTMFGGRLETPRLRLGYSFATPSGAEKLSILDASADIIVAGELYFGTSSTFVAVPGTTIHMTTPAEIDFFPPLDGNRFQNYSTNPAALSGLANLTLIFEGGLENPATFEVAGEDRGPDLGGFFENFVLDTLQVGGVDEGSLSLVDLVDNQLDGAGNEALYVKNLIVGPGSHLDLAGLNLYYLSAEIATDAIIDAALFLHDATLAGALPGDGDLNGVVDTGDYILWADGFGMVNPKFTDGDYNSDGSTDAADYTVWANNFGQSVSAPRSAATAVPEPETFSLLAIGLMGLLLRRARKPLDDLFSRA